MKAPDKIVMPEATSQLRFTMTESVEYIRKGALMEWASGEITLCYEHSCHNHKVYELCAAHDLMWKEKER